eukprot:SAG31_NODE_998_length_10460_cov_255.143505_12_plen_95_part_00
MRSLVRIGHGLLRVGLDRAPFSPHLVVIRVRYRDTPPAACTGGPGVPVHVRTCSTKFKFSTAVLGKDAYPTIPRWVAKRQLVDLGMASILKFSM